MDNLDLIECRHCEWSIATDPVVFDFSVYKLNDAGKSAVISMSKHLIDNHPVKKYLALRNMKLKDKWITIKLFNEIKRGAIREL